MYGPLAIIVTVGSVMTGIRSVPSTVAYRPMSLAVASSSQFQETQFSLPSFGLMSEFMNVVFGVRGRSRGRGDLSHGKLMRLLI
jgi:hypothetical protein